MNGEVNPPSKGLWDRALSVHQIGDVHRCPIESSKGQTVANVFSSGSSRWTK